MIRYRACWILQLLTKLFLNDSKRGENMQHRIHIRRKINPKVSVTFAIITFAIILAGWSALNLSGMVSDIFLPTPVEVVKRFIMNLMDGSLWADTWASIYRIIMGFILAAVLAIPIGILCAVFSPVSAFLKPLCEFVRYMPVPAFVPLLMVWIGIGEMPKILIIFIGTFFQMVLMIIDNADAVPDDLLAAGYTLGAGNGKAIFTVLIPDMAPSMMQTVRMMIGWAWTYLVVAELVAANTGLGYSILKAQRFLQTDTIFMGILVIGILGLLTDCVLNLVIKKIFPWTEGER